MKLADFILEVNWNLAEGDIDKYLTITDKNGEYPVVGALGEEPVSILLERVNAIGGTANIFVKSKGHVTLLGTDRHQPLAGNPCDMSDKNEWESGSAPISMLLEVLKQHKDGVLLPTELPDGSEYSITISSDTIPMEEPSLV